jgi:hypothetical protein
MKSTLDITTRILVVINTNRVKTVLYGSLALTGEGHHTPQVIYTSNKEKII